MMSHFKREARREELRMNARWGTHHHHTRTGSIASSSRTTPQRLQTSSAGSSPSITAEDSGGFTFSTLNPPVTITPTGPSSSQLCSENCNVQTTSSSPSPVTSSNAPKVATEDIFCATPDIVGPTSLSMSLSKSTTNYLTTSPVPTVTSISQLATTLLTTPSPISKVSQVVTKSTSPASDTQSLKPVTTSLSTTTPIPEPQLTSQPLSSSSLPSSKPSTTATFPPLSNHHQHTSLSGLSPAAKAGAILGLLLLVAAILSSALFFLRRQKCRPGYIFPFALRQGSSSGSSIRNRSSPSISASYFPVPSRMEERRDDAEPLIIYAGEVSDILFVFRRRRGNSEDRDQCRYYADERYRLEKV